MRLTDGKKTIEIELKKWDGCGWYPDYARDFFAEVCLRFDDETNTHIVEDVDYCIKAAKEYLWDCIANEEDDVEDNIALVQEFDAHDKIIKEYCFYISGDDVKKRENKNPGSVLWAD